MQRRLTDSAHWVEAVIGNSTCKAPHDALALAIQHRQRHVSRAGKEMLQLCCVLDLGHNVGMGLHLVS